jgi:transcription elongation factor GreA
LTAGFSAGIGLDVADELPIIKVIKAELVELEHELAVDLPRQIETARAHGDLSENAEYHAAKERQGLVHARVGMLTGRLSELSLYDLSSVPADKVGYGSRVTVVDVDSGDKRFYELVFPEETAPEKGRISLQSPVGQALLHKQVGDEAVVRSPSGKRTYEILELVTVHDRKAD